MRGLWHRYGFGTTLVFWLWPLMLSAAPKPTDVVAEVDGHSITVEEVQKKLAGLSVDREKMSLMKIKREIVHELINDYLINLRARTISLKDDTTFLQRVDYQLNQIAAWETFNKAVGTAVAVTDSEVTERYQQKPENYQLRERVRASHILIAPVKDTGLLTPRQKETGWWGDSESQVKLIADSLYRAIRAGASFDSLAREWSQDMPSGSRGGDLGIFFPGQMVPEFDSVSFRLPVGSVSAPVKTQFGYHIIKVISRQEAGVAPLDDSLRMFIKQQVLNEKIVNRTYAFLDSLHQAAGLTFNEKIFDHSDSLLRVEKVWAVASTFGDTILSDRFAAQLIMARPIAPGNNVDKKFKTNLLRDLINPLLVRRAARDLKILESETYLTRKEQLFQNERISRINRERLIEYNPTEEEVLEYYRTNKTSLLVGESLSVHVQQMVFKTKGEVERVLEEIRAGGDFALLAHKYFPGDSDIAQEAFDLGFISPPAMPKDFFAVAETLTIGAVSQPVRTPWGYHLIRVVARRPDLSLEVARPKIVVAIRRAKLEEHKRKWEAALREGHVISVNERVLKSIRFDPSQAGISRQP